MRKVLLLLLCLSFVIPARSAVDVVTPTGSTAAQQIPCYDVNVQKFSDRLRVTYVFDSLTLVPDPVFPGCHNLLIGGFVQSSMQGAPAVPVLLERFSVPPGNSYSVQVVEQQSYDLPVILAPARPVLSENSEYTFLTTPVEPIPATNEFGPYESVSDCGVQIFRKQPIANIQIAPVTYNPAKNLARIASKLCFDIIFTADESAVTETPDEETNYICKAITLQPTENKEKAKASNYDTMRFRTAYVDYIVVTSDALKPAAEKFAEWKRSLGYTVGVHSATSWDAARTAALLSAWYDTAVNPLYAVFFGEQNHVAPYGYPHGAPSDFQYGCMDGPDDIMPDINLGRIPASTLAEAENAVSKIISYEENPMGSLRKTRALFAAYFQDWDDDKCEDRDFARCTELIYNAFPDRFDSRTRIYYCDTDVNPTYWSPTYFRKEMLPLELRKPLFPWNGSVSFIKSSMAVGCNLLFYRGHGAVNGWSAPSFKSSDLQYLSNTTYPIIISSTCLSGNYTKPNNFARRILCIPNRGCATIVAASDSTFSGHNDLMACAMFASLFPEEGFRYDGTKNISGGQPHEGKASSIGDMLNIGLINMERQAKDGTILLDDEMVAYKQLQRERYHCFGDPGLAVCWNSSLALKQIASITEFGGYITVDLGVTSAYISIYDPETAESIRVYGNYATLRADNPENAFISITQPGMIPHMGTFKEICTVGDANPKDNYIDRYDIYGNSVFVNVVLNYSASFGVSAEWKLNAYVQSGANISATQSVKIPDWGGPAEFLFPQLKSGDIVRLTLTNGNKIIDKKAILIRNQS